MDGSIPSCTYSTISLSNHQFLDTSFFQTLAIVDSAEVNVREQTSFQNSAGRIFGLYAENGFIRVLVSHKDSNFLSLLLPLPPQDPHKTRQ